MENKAKKSKPTIDQVLGKSSEPEIDLAPPDVQEEIPTQEYYDADELKGETRDLLSKFTLEDLEFEPTQYHLFLDSLGDLTQAARFFGLDKLGIAEDADDGFELNGQKAPALEELEGLREALDQKAAEVAGALTAETEMPGSYFFDLDEEDGTYDLLYFFEDGDLPALEEQGFRLRTEASDAAFSEIISALESEGCHDIAERLHAVLFIPEN